MNKKFLTIAAAISAFISAAANAQPVDPAIAFVAKFMMGDREAAMKSVVDPISQATDQPAVPNKPTLTSKEFLKAVEGCQIDKFEDKDYIPKTSAKLVVHWDCTNYALVARVKSHVYEVQITQFQKLLYVPGG